MPIIIHCFYTGAAGVVRGFFDEMQAGLQSAVYAEDGCIQYDYYLSAKDGGAGVLLGLDNGDSADKDLAKDRDIARINCAAAIQITSDTCVRVDGQFSDRADSVAGAAPEGEEYLS